MSPDPRSLLRIALAVGLLALAGCGFRPIYADNPAGAGPSTLESMAAVRVSPIAAGRPGQILRTRLEDMLAPQGGEDSRYRLDIRLREDKRDLLIREDDTTTRAMVTLTADWRLIEAETGQVLLEEVARSDNSLNVLPSDYATLIAEQDARERGLTDLADRITTRIALHFQNQTSS